MVLSAAVATSTTQRGYSRVEREQVKVGEDDKRDVAQGNVTTWKRYTVLVG